MWSSLWYFTHTLPKRKKYRFYHTVVGLIGSISYFLTTKMLIYFIKCGEPDEQHRKKIIILYFLNIFQHICRLCLLSVIIWVITPHKVSQKLLFNCVCVHARAWERACVCVSVGAVGVWKERGNGKVSEKNWWMHSVQKTVVWPDIHLSLYKLPTWSHCVKCWSRSMAELRYKQHFKPSSQVCRPHFHKSWYKKKSNKKNWISYLGGKSNLGLLGLLELGSHQNYNIWLFLLSSTPVWTRHIWFRIT